MRPFNGDITLWNTFWESYDSAVHRNRDLSELSVDWHSSRSSLWTITNYAEVVAILKKRFGNTDQIKARDMDILMKIEPMTSLGDLKALRRVHLDLVIATRKVFEVTNLYK